MKQLLIAVLAPQQNNNIFNELFQIAATIGCNIISCQVMPQGTAMSITLLLSGNWSMLAKFEAALPGFRDQFDLQYIATRTEAVATNHGELLPYSIQVVAVDNKGIIHQISQFLLEQQIEIQAIFASTYIAPRSKISMLSLNMAIGITSQCHLADFRERFMLFCDDLNVDAILEPEKP